MMMIGRALAIAAVVTVGMSSLADAFAFRNSGFSSCIRSGWGRRCAGTSRWPSSVAMMAGNRRSRRFAEDKKKGKTYKQGPMNQPGGAKSDAKWLQVLDSAPDIEPGSAKVVSGKYKGEDKFFTLAAHGGRYFAISEACGRCKFPLINGKVKTLDENNEARDVVKGEEEDSEAEVAIGCPLCGVMYNMGTGDVVGEKPSGFAQGLVSKLLSQKIAERVKNYDARALASGAVVVRVD